MGIVNFFITYNNLRKKDSTEVKEVQKLTIQNESYQEAQKSLEYANNYLK